MIFKKTLSILFIDYAISNIINRIYLNLSCNKREFDILIESIKKDLVLKGYNSKLLDKIINEKYDDLYGKYVFVNKRFPKYNIYRNLKNAIDIYLYNYNRKTIHINTVVKL